MSLTQAAIEQNRLTLVALLGILVAGILAYLNLPRSEDPGFTVRTARVITYLPGASPVRVEQLITDKLEQVIQELPEVDFVESESKTGISVIAVEIQERYDIMRPIWDDLRRKVEDSQRDLPANTIGPFVNDEFGDVFGIILTLTGEGFSYAELKTIAEEIRDELLYLEQTAKVSIYGEQPERVFIDYNNARLAELGLSPYSLSRTLSERNILISGGSIVTEQERITLEPTGNFESIADLKRSVIRIPGSQEVLFLEDIAHVYRDYIDPPELKVKASGQPALVLALSMRQGGNIITLGEQVKALLPRLQNSYPIGINLAIANFEPHRVANKVNNFVMNLLQAVGIVAAVMLLMLGLRTGLVVAALVPMTILMSLMLMSILDIGLDKVSLAALIIALGMLVDNGIVMAESILVHMHSGKTAQQAAIDSAAELRWPLLISSLTTAAAFLPIFLAQSTTGEYTAPLFKVVTITLLSSWLLALTMIPLFAVLFIRVKKTTDNTIRYDSYFYRVYRFILLLGLRWRFLTLLLILSAFFLAIQGMQAVPKIFFPPTDNAFFTAELELPQGTAIETTEQVVTDIEDFLQQHFEGQITDWVTYIGSGGPRFILPHRPEPPNPHYAFMIINVTDFRLIDELIAQVQAFTFEHFPELHTTLKKIGNGPPIERPVAIRISGNDIDKLFNRVEQVKVQLRHIPGTQNISDDWGLRTKKLLVKIDQPRARRAGVSSQDIAISLQTGLSGLELTTYREGNELIPIIMRSTAADRHDISKLESLNVYAQASGRTIPLKQVADIEVVWEMSKILRRNRLRTVTVGSEVQAGVTANDVFEHITPWLQQTDWGVGYRYELGGEVEISNKANRSIMVQLPVAGLIILLLLIGLFNSIRRTIIVVLTIPLGLIGVVIGLLVANSYFGFMTLLGIISLSGIVINNAVVLLDRINIEREAHEARQAVVNAAQHRLRPILLTTVTTVLGLLPLWFGGDVMFKPMAIAIIFGLLFATVLTLGVVPVFYSLLYRLSFKGFRYRNES
ncbi:MAG: efflux RND transporter permease subunit [Pseudomonadota bacterium]|nr:efflux RND transporter permease subunit [Pseudomonadota bacterium]